MSALIPKQSLSVEQQRQRLLDAILKLPVGYGRSSRWRSKA